MGHAIGFFFTPFELGCLLFAVVLCTLTMRELWDTWREARETRVMRPLR
jgi:hypothetical protein